MENLSRLYVGRVGACLAVAGEVGCMQCEDLGWAKKMIKSHFTA